MIAKHVQIGPRWSSYSGLDRKLAKKPQSIRYIFWNVDVCMWMFRKDVLNIFKQLGIVGNMWWWYNDEEDTVPMETVTGYQIKSFSKQTWPILPRKWMITRLFQQLVRKLPICLKFWTWFLKLIMAYEILKCGSKKGYGECLQFARCGELSMSSKDAQMTMLSKLLKLQQFPGNQSLISVMVKFYYV